MLHHIVIDVPAFPLIMASARDSSPIPAAPPVNATKLHAATTLGPIDPSAKVCDFNSLGDAGLRAFSVAFPILHKLHRGRCKAAARPSRTLPGKSIRKAFYAGFYRLLTAWWCRACRRCAGFLRRSFTRFTPFPARPGCPRRCRQGAPARRTGEPDHPRSRVRPAVPASASGVWWWRDV